MGIESALQLRQITLSAPTLGPIDVPIYPFVADLNWGCQTDKTPDFVEGEVTRDSPGAFVVTRLTGYYMRATKTYDNPRGATEIYTHNRAAA